MNIGRMILLAGVALVALGTLWMAFDKFGIHLGRLPGDIVWKKGNTTIYLPVTTCVLLSIIFTIIIRLFKR